MTAEAPGGVKHACDIPKDLLRFLHANFHSHDDSDPKIRASRTAGCYAATWLGPAPYRNRRVLKVTYSAAASFDRIGSSISKPAPSIALVNTIGSEFAKALGSKLSSSITPQIVEGIQK
jgi:hypothetical protein